MKTLDEFVKTMVRIEFLEDENCYGHYPFQLFVETKDETFEMCALALGGDVLSCYRKFGEYKNDDAKRIYLSLDFPSGGDIENDFVAIFSMENDKIDLFAIPYSTKDGAKLELINKSSHLDLLKSEFLKGVKSL